MVNAAIVGHFTGFLSKPAGAGIPAYPPPITSGTGSSTQFFDNRRAGDGMA
jgi:hypothetical protein